MNRRDFLSRASGVAASLTVPRVSSIFREEHVSADWRMFEVTTRAEILKSSSSVRVWLPAALLGETRYQKTFVNTFDAEGGTAKLVESKPDGLAMLMAEFSAGIKPVVTLKSRIATRNYAIDLSKLGKGLKENRAELEHFLRPTKLLPTECSGQHAFAGAPAI